MAVSEAKSAANARWDAANMGKITVKMRKSDLERFRAACAARGTTGYGYLLAAARALIAEDAANTPDADATT